MPFQVLDAFNEFNQFTAQLTENIWYLDTENKIGLFSSPDELYPLSPMHLAAKNGNVDAIEFFIQNLTIDQNPSLHGTLQVFQKGMTPMHIGASHGNLEIVKLIKDRLDLLNPSDAYGYTVLHEAACKGHLDIVKELVKDLQEKNPTQNENGQLRPSPLHEAASHGHVNVLQYFQKILPNMSTVDSFGNTALHLHPT